MFSDGRGMVVADLRGQGRRDIVRSAGCIGQILRTRLSDGAGGFLPEAGSGPNISCIVQTDLGSGDLTGDGRADVVSLDFNFNNMFVHVNNGQGQLGSGEQSGAGISPLAVQIADVDGFSGNDVIFIRSVFGSSNVTVRYNTGIGLPGQRLTADVGYGLPGAPVAFVAAKFRTASPLLDLAVATRIPSGVRMMLNANDGSGSFTASATLYPLPTQARTISAGDLDGDGFLDVVVTTPDDGSIHILYGAGDGTFTAPARIQTGGSAVPLPSPVAAEISDADGDGLKDIVVAESGPDAVRIVRQTAARVFTAPVSTIVINLGGFRSVQEINIDDDGRPDIALSGNSASIYLLRNVSNQPSVLAQPAPTRICPAATFSVTATSTLPMTFSWRRNGVALTGPRFVAVTSNQGLTSTLTIQDATRADLGVYDCVVSNTCGSSTSAAASLTECRSDFTCSGTPDIDDIFVFLNAWFASEPRADIDGVGGRTIDDIFVFLNLWFAGC